MVVYGNGIKKCGKSVLALSVIMDSNFLKSLIVLSILLRTVPWFYKAADHLFNIALEYSILICVWDWYYMCTTGFIECDFDKASFCQ